MGNAQRMLLAGVRRRHVDRLGNSQLLQLAQPLEVRLAVHHHLHRWANIDGAVDGIVRPLLVIRLHGPHVEVPRFHWTIIAAAAEVIGIGIVTRALAPGEDRAHGADRFGVLLNRHRQPGRPQGNDDVRTADGHPTRKASKTKCKKTRKAENKEASS